MINIANNYSSSVIEASNLVIPLLKDLARKANLTSENKDFFSSTVVFKWAEIQGAKVKTILETHKKYGTDMEESDIVNFEYLAKKSISSVPKNLFKDLTPEEIDDITIYTSDKL